MSKLQKPVNEMMPNEQMRHWIDIVNDWIKSDEYQYQMTEGKSGDNVVKIVLKRKVGSSPTERDL